MLLDYSIVLLKILKIKYIGGSNMNIMNNFITDYGFHVIAATLTGVISYIGIQLKNVISNFYQHRIEKEEAEIVCRAVEKIYSNLPSNQKLEEAITSLKVILKEKNIETTDLEIRILIENAVHHIKGNNQTK